jgi:opacity protein-like surface antigen
MKAQRSLMVLALAAAFAAPAAAQDLEGRWTVAFQGGTDSELSGKVISGVQGELFERPVTIESRKYREIYDPDVRLQALVGYGVSPSSEIFVRASHYKMESPGGVPVGTVVEDPLYAYLDPYEEWGVEIGYRFYLASRTSLKSYIAPVGGVRFLDRMLLSLSAPDRGSAIFNLPMYNASTVAVFGLDVGFTYDLGSRFYIGLEAELRYQTKPAVSGTAPGLAGINSDGSRLSAPVLATVGVRF